MKSKKVIDQYRRIHKAFKAVAIETSGWKVKEAGVEFTEDERKLTFECVREFWEIEAKYDTIWEKKIGEAVAHEVRVGKWK